MADLAQERIRARNFLVLPNEASNTISVQFELFNYAGTYGPLPASRDFDPTVPVTQIKDTIRAEFLDPLTAKRTTLYNRLNNIREALAGIEVA